MAFHIFCVLRLFGKTADSWGWCCLRQSHWASPLRYCMPHITTKLSDPWLCILIIVGYAMKAFVPKLRWCSDKCRKQKPDINYLFRFANYNWFIINLLFHHHSKLLPKLCKTFLIDIVFMLPPTRHVDLIILWNIFLRRSCGKSFIGNCWLTSFGNKKLLAPGSIKFPTSKASVLTWRPTFIEIYSRTPRMSL